MESLQAGEIYRHYKGGLYRILGLGQLIKSEDINDKISNGLNYDSYRAKIEYNLEKCTIITNDGIAYIVPDMEYLHIELGGQELVAYIGIESQLVWVRTVEEWNAPIEKEGQENLKRFVKWEL